MSPVKIESFVKISTARFWSDEVKLHCRSVTRVVSAAAGLGDGAVSDWLETNGLGLASLMIHLELEL